MAIASWAAVSFEVNMFHIPDDKRAKKSADLIFKALIECLKIKPLSDITAKDIQKTCGVSRATYYRLFGNNTDILRYGCMALSERIARECPEFPHDEKALERFSLYVIKAWMENQDVLEALNRCGKNSLLIECIRMNTDQVKNIRILYAFGDTSFDYFINIVYGMLCAILTTWIQRGRQESAEDINEIFLKLTGSCFKEGNAL